MADDRDIPRAEQEAGLEGAPGYGAALLAVLVMIGVTAVLGLLIYLLMVAIRPIETPDSKSRPSARPILQTPTTPPPPAVPAK